MRLPTAGTTSDSLWEKHNGTVSLEKSSWDVKRDTFSQEN